MIKVWFWTVRIVVLFTTVRVCWRAWHCMTHLDFAVILFMAGVTLLSIIRQQIEDGWV